MSMDALRRLYAASPRMGKATAEAESFSRPTMVIRNSFCTLHSIPKEPLKVVEEALTYTNESIAMEKKRAFRLLSMAKARNQPKLIYKIKRMLEELDRQEIVCWLRHNTFPTGHLAIVRGILSEQGVAFTEDDRRILPTSKHVFHFKNPQHELRYYQDDMANLALEHSRGVYVSAVGTGKSRILQEILRLLGLTSLIVVPSSALLEQTYNGLENAFGSKYVGKISTAKIKSLLSSKSKKAKKLPPIRIATIQTVAALQKKRLLGPLIENLDLIAVDEIHHAGSKSYTELLPELDHIYYRFGFTGTFTRNDGKLLDMWGFLSNVLYVYSATQAVKEGYLTPVEFLVHSLEGNRCANYQKEYNRNYCGSEALLAEIERIFEQYVSTDEQVLILVDRKDAAGLVIHEMLTDLGIENTYVSGDDKKEDVSEVIQAFNRKEIRVMVGSTIIGEGVDVFSTNRLILARGGKSEIAIPQAIGRAIRLAPGKTKAFVHDFRFENTKYLEKHLEIRLAMYRDSFGGSIVEGA